MPTEKHFLNTIEAAVYTGFAAATLEKLRHYGNGPKFIRRPGGRRILYLVEDLDSWLLPGRRSSTSDPGPEAT